MSVLPSMETRLKRH